MCGKQYGLKFIRVNIVILTYSIYCRYFVFHIYHTIDLVPLTVDALLWRLGTISLCRKLGASWRSKGLWMGTATLTYHSGSTLQHGIHWLGTGRREGHFFFSPVFIIFWGQLYQRPAVMNLS